MLPKKADSLTDALNLKLWINKKKGLKSPFFVDAPFYEMAI